ncbi:hypothetical protein [Mycoplasmopsis lipofaciens]|uniref:hypothetical protein n=1 Tax=Mycoplasmopsis lipofaciens TaxID=114884 RepID=UPI00048792A3|nr:hypothetical protein [Mycoplasmopsis lipofaciens]
MKKANIKVKTVVWAIATVISIIILILGSILVHNALFVLEVSKKADLNFKLINDAYTKLSYGIGIIFFSIIACLVGGYISYAGIRSWNYNAIL